MRERGIDDHILAWVYSVDFPTMIRTSPAISIQGITFVRNKIPDPEEVKKGTYCSLLFTGPGTSQSTPHFPQTLDVYRKWLGEDMPLPSMMLGYTGKRGNTVQTIIRCLEKGAASDGTAPEGTVYFVTSDNVRSECRQWQYGMAQRELVAMGVKAVITGKFPRGRNDIIGLMMGAAKVKPDQGNRYAAGCMAEHLTSAAAAFQSASQTKLSAWIDAGVTASAGTVTEPLSIWTKFPNAWFFVHYASGCCVMESFFQSIRCPLQILLVGEPLAQPWGPKGDLILSGLEDPNVTGILEVGAEVRSEPEAHYGQFMFLLDGKMIDTGGLLEFDTTTVDDGVHTLRAVGYRTGLVRSQVFREKKIVISNGRKKMAETAAGKSE